MAISRSVAGNNARPARVIGYIRVIPPLVFLVDHGHVRSHRLGEGGHHQVDGGLPRSGSRLHIADGEALGPPVSRRHRPDPVDLDSRLRTEVLLFRRSLWSLRTIRECGEHHETCKIRRQKDGPDGPTRLRSTLHRRHRQSGACSRWMIPFRKAFSTAS